MDELARSLQADVEVKVLSGRGRYQAKKYAVGGRMISRLRSTSAGE